MAELAKRVRAKDPEGFKDWTDDELEQSWLEKYPGNTAYMSLAGEKARIAANNSVVEANLAKSAKHAEQPVGYKPGSRMEYLTGKPVEIAADKPFREDVQDVLSGTIGQVAKVTGPAVQAIASNADMSREGLGSKINRSIGIEPENLAAESDLKVIQSDADRRRLARALAKAFDESNPGTLGGGGVYGDRGTANVFESMPLETLQSKYLTLMPRAQEIMAEEKANRDATAEQNRQKVSAEIERVNSFPVTDEQRSTLLEQGLQRTQREAYGNDHAEALRFGRDAAARTMAQTKDPKAAMAAAQDATIKYYQTLIQAAKGRGLGDRASQNTATYEQFIKTFSDPREFSRMALQTGIPMAIAYASGVGGAAMAARIAAQFYGTAATTAALQGIYDGEIDPVDVIIESASELVEIPAMDVVRGMGAATGKGIIPALGEAARVAGRTTTSAGTEFATEALQTAGSELVKTGRVISGPEAISAGTQGAIIGAGAPSVFSAVEQALATTPSAPVDTGGQTAFDFAPTEGQQLGLPGVDIALQEPALRNLAPPGGFQVPEDTQNKPVAAQGAEDAAAEKKGKGIGSRIGEVARKGYEYAKAHPYELGATFAGGLAGGAIGGLAGGSVGAWGGRQVGRHLGKVGGVAADAERAADASAQNKPVASVGADDAAVKTPTIEEALRGLFSQAAEGQQAEVPADLAQRAGVAPLAAAEEEAPLARFIDAAIRGDAVAGTEPVQMEMFAEQPGQQLGLFDQPTGDVGTTPETAPPTGEPPAPLGPIEGRFGQTLDRSQGRLPVEIPTHQGTALESQMAGVQSEQEGRLPPGVSAGIPQRNLPPAVLGMVERAFDRHGPSGALELAVQLGVSEEDATNLINELTDATNAGDRVPTSEPVNQFEETTTEPVPPTEAAPTAARPGGPVAAKEAMNLLDVIEQEANRQAKEYKKEAPKTEPKRPANVEPQIPEEMARQLELADKAKTKQKEREKEPGYEERKANLKASPAYKQTYDQMIADGFPDKTARAAAYKAAEKAAAETKAKEEGEGLEGKLQASVTAEKPAAAPKPAPKPEPKAEAVATPAAPAKEPTTVQEFLNAGRIEEAREKARAAVSNPDETVTRGDYLGMKVGDLLPGGAMILGVSGGLIDETTKPPKKAPGPLRKEPTEDEGGPITRQYAGIAEGTRKAPPTEGNQFRASQAGKELGKLQKTAREAGVYGTEQAGPGGAGGAGAAVQGDRGPQSVVPEASRGRDLEGLPATVKVNGEERVYGGFKPAQQVAEEYVSGTGRKYNPPKTYVKVDKDRAKRIADAYETMKHAPDDPDVKAAYEAMIRETLDQYDAILKTGLVVEFIEPGKDPYPNPRMAIDDVVQNNHLWVFPTDTGFGTSESFDASKNPLLAPTTYKISGKVATANDIFRAVHDYFGHIKNGVGFRADGEENAWRSHSSMYSPLARRAMTTETRGQNSWLNYGPYGEKNRTAKTEDTVFADQKTGLLPEWAVTEGAADPTPETPPKKGKPLAGIVRPDSFGTIEAWKNHVRELGFTEEQISDAERVFTATQQEPLAKKKDGSFDTVALLDSEEVAAPGSKTLKEVFAELKGKDITKLSEEEQVKIIAEKMLPEMRRQMRQVNSGIGWYKTDIEAMEHALKNPQPELNDSEEMLIMKMIAAATSFGQDPNTNIESALTLYRAFKETGEMAERQETGKHWPGKPNFEINAKKFTRMAKELGGMKALAKWMTEKHPISEIRRFNPNVKIKGKASDMQYGSYVLGPKGGPFFQNLIGNRDLVTGDRWDNRAMHRLMGTPISDKATLAQRTVFNKASEVVAKKLGVEQADLQAMRWFYEKSVYEAMGVKKASFGTYSVAGRRAVEGIPAKEGRLSARSELKEESKSIATEVKFGTDSPYGKKYNWSSLTPEQQRKVTDAHGKYLIEAIEAATGVKVERADPGKGVYEGDANPNWIVKVKGTPQQIEAAASLFGLGSQQDSVIASRKVEPGEGKVGLDVSSKTKGTDWAKPDFIDKVWAEYARIAPDLAKEAGASLEFDDNGVSIRMFNDGFADKGTLTRAAAAIQSAIKNVDPKATPKVSPQEFEVSYSGNSWSESAGGEAYKQALRDRGFADAEINKFVEGADASIEKAWNKHAAKGALKKDLDLTDAIDRAIAELKTTEDNVRAGSEIIRQQQLRELDLMEPKTGEEMKTMAKEDPVAYALYSSTNVLFDNFIRAAFGTSVSRGRKMNLYQAYKGSFIPEETETAEDWIGSRNPVWRGGSGQLRISRASALDQAADNLSQQIDKGYLLAGAANGDPDSIAMLRDAYKQELKGTLAHEILHGFEDTVDTTASRDPKEKAKMKRMQALMNKSADQLLLHELPDGTTLGEMLEPYFDTKSMDKHWDAEIQAMAKTVLGQTNPTKPSKPAQGSLFKGKGGPGGVRTSTRDALESLESARKPRKAVRGVLEHIVDTKPRIAPPAKPKAPLEGMIKG